MIAHRFAPAIAEAPRAPSEWDDYWERIGEGSWLFREQSELYVRKLVKAITLRSDMRVLDFGCGFGFVAEILADHVREVHLWDAAENMRRHAAARVARRVNCRVIDSRDVSALPGQRFDVILVNSVVQYVPRSTFAEWLVNWRTVLARGGSIVVSDIVPSEPSAYRDLMELLHFGYQCSRFQRTLRQILRELGTYGKRRQRAPLTAYSTEELNALAKEANLRLDMLPFSLTHFRKRLSARFRVSAPGLQGAP